MLRPSTRPILARITGQEIMAVAVGSSVLIWAGVLNFLLV